MKKLGQIMNELGFREDGSDATKAAFIRYLVKATLNTNLQTPPDLKLNVDIGPTHKDQLVGEQLEFKFADDEQNSTRSDKRKSG